MHIIFYNEYKLTMCILIQEDHLEVINKAIHMFTIIAHISPIATTLIMNILESHGKPNENQTSYNSLPYLIFYCAN